MVHWVWADGKSCIVCIRGSGEKRLFIVVSVICLKGLPCFSDETTLVTVTRTEHLAGKDCIVATKCHEYCKGLANLTSFSKYFDHNIPCSGHLVMDTPVLAALCVFTLTNYVTILDVYKKTLQS